MNAGYAKYLKTGHWAQLRKRALSFYGNACFLCRFTESLEVHHLTYRKRVIDATLDDLLILCGACHSRAHWWLDRNWLREDVGNQEKRDRLEHLFKRESDRSRTIRKNGEAKRVLTIPLADYDRQRRAVDEAIEHGLNIRD